MTDSGNKSTEPKRCTHGARAARGGRQPSPCLRAPCWRGPARRCLRRAPCLLLKARGSGHPQRSPSLNSRNSRRFKERSTRLLQIVRDAASLEPEIAELWERIQVEYHANQLAVVRSLGPGALRRGLGERRAADIIWSLNHPNTWIQLSVLRGWTPAQYERWVGDTSCQQLLA